MAVTVEASGTLSTTGSSTEDFIENTNVAAVFSLHLDLNDMVDGDVIEVRIYQIVLTGGTARVVWINVYYGAQPDHAKNIASLPIGNELTDANSLRFSIKQTFGTAGVSIPWKVLKYA